ncbi:MAG: type II secretion system protein F, partial [Campylobacteraceae bacterium 4484_4]
MNYYEVSFLFKGKRDTQMIKAVTRMDAITIAKAKMPGATILKAYEVSPPLEDQIEEWKNKFFGTLSQKKIKTENLISAIRQLAVMTNAGISIHDSIKEVAKATVDKQLKEIFEDIDEELNAGRSLTEAMQRYKYQLGDVTIAMVELGENTGNMSESLTKLSEILEEVMENTKKLKSALRYPITVIIAIAIAFTILMVYVVPKFKEIFAKFNAELPMPTKVLLFLYKNNELYKRKTDKYILKLYLIGNVIFYASMSRFMLIFTELVRAGIPIADALDTAVITIDNEEIKDKLATVKQAVGRGANLTEAFEETGLYEGMLIQMIRAGEQGGALDKMLEKVSEYYKSRFQDIIDNLSSYIEPILIGFIAGMVLMMALGIFLP